MTLTTEWTQWKQELVNWFSEKKNHIQTDKQRDKRMENIGDLKGNVGQSDTCVIGTPEGEEKEKEAGATPRGITTYNSSKLMKWHKPQPQELQSPVRTSRKATTPKLISEIT